MRKLVAALSLLLLVQPAQGVARPKPPIEAQRLAARAAAITITRDRLGIAHVRARTDADAVFGMAYAQAEDDFHRVEWNYLGSLGRLSEAEGEAAVWKDLRQRLWVDHDDLKRRYAGSAPWLRTLLTGWADGLNHYLATHPQVRPAVLTRFEPWMALSFSEGSIGGDIEYVDLGKLRALYEKTTVTAAVARPAWPEPKGSNGIAIAPSRTANGKALLLINPHTSFFFRDVVQVTSDEGLNAYGAVTWGQPFIYQGFNDRAGWMHTSSGLDSRDEFAETLVSRGGKIGMRYGSGWRPISLRPVTLRVRQANGPLASRTIVTMHGMHGPLIRNDGGKFIAYSILNDPVAAIEQSFLRTKARTLDDFTRVAARRANSSNNTLFADAGGEIAYLHPQFVPVRSEKFDYRRPVDGANPATEWRGLHTLDSLPRLVNPKSGFVFNVNDSPWSAAGKGSLDEKAYPAYMDQWGWSPRTDHALRVLERETAFTPEKLIAAAYDRDLPGFDLLLPSLFKAYDGLPAKDPRRARLRDGIAMLRGWDHRWSADSEALTLTVHWGEALHDSALKGVSPLDANATAYRLMEAATPAVKLTALEAAEAKMKAMYGSTRVAWGTINRFQRNDGSIVQKFDDAKPSIAVPFPSASWGTLASFGASTYPGTTKRYGTSGNSFVAVVEFGRDGPRAWAVTAGGVNGDPASPHFADQAGDYAKGKLNRVPFTPAEIAAAAEEVYHPGQRRNPR